MIWSKREVAVWGLGMCGGSVDTETVGVFLWKTHPGIFALRRFPQYPDVEVARRALSHCALGAEPMVIKKPKGMWELNDAGRAWFEKNKKSVSAFLGVASASGERRSALSLVSVKKIAAAVEARIKNTQGFAAFVEAKPGDRKKHLLVKDFFSVFSIDEHTPFNLYEESRRRILLAISCEFPVGKKYVTALADRFGDRYQSIMDEMVEKGGFKK